MNTVKIIVGVSVGVLLAIILLSSAPSIANAVGYFLGQLWYSGAFGVLLFIAALLWGLLWRDRVQAQRRINAGGGRDRGKTKTGR